MKLRRLTAALLLLLSAAPLAAQPPAPRAAEWRGLTIPGELGRFELADRKEDEENGRPRLRLVYRDAEDELVFVDLYADPHPVRLRLRRGSICRTHGCGHGWMRRWACSWPRWPGAEHPRSGDARRTTRGG